jgi:AcrR family transcriptional regulator
MARPRSYDEGEVLDRAMDVFWRHGYEGASMAELTHAMALNSTSIYAAFGSKRGLFGAVLERYRARRTAHRDAILAAKTGREIAERMLFGAIEWLVGSNEPRGCLLIQSVLAAGVASGDIPGIVKKQRTAVLDLLIDRLRLVQEAGELAPSEDPVALARYIQMAFNGLALQAADGASAADLRAAAERALLGWPSGGQ